MDHGFVLFDSGELRCNAFGSLITTDLVNETDSFRSLSSKHATVTELTNLLRSQSAALRDNTTKNVCTSFTASCIISFAFSSDGFDMDIMSLYSPAFTLSDFTPIRFSISEK